MSHYSKHDTRTTTQRGLGWQHQQRRKSLLPSAVGTQCPGPFHGRRSAKCSGLMTERRLMHLDENPPRAVGTPTQWRICCAACNLSSGAQLGNALQQRAFGKRRSHARLRRAQSRVW